MDRLGRKVIQVLGFLVMAIAFGLLGLAATSSLPREPYVCAAPL
jgi:hypothetical protein